MTTPEKKAKADVQRSGISWTQAKAAGMFTVPDASELHDKFHAVSAMVIPYMDPATGTVMLEDGQPFYRLRYLDAPQLRAGFKKQKAPRYVQPPGSEVHALLPAAGVDWTELAADRDQPVLITEGEKKALATTLEVMPTIGLGGVYNFTYLPDQLLPELEAIDWRKRVVYVAFDSDIADNPDVQAAESRLIALLAHKYGAVVKPIRIPLLDDHGKMGLDDYLVTFGAKAVKKLIKDAKSLGRAETAVAAMNQAVCYIEREAMVYEFATKLFIRKDSLTNGSKYSALKYAVPKKKGGGMEEVSVPRMWLTDPHACRYDDIVFAPDSTDKVLETENGRALNMWTGFETGEGDPTPFLELTKFLFQNLPPDLQDLPLKLVAYKAQNPGVKIPLAIVLVGLQGSGKSLWASILNEAFSPYAMDIQSRALASEFNGHLEHSLLTVIGEAEPADLHRFGGTLRTWITDIRQPFNEKYRANRQINSYAFYILTSNKHGVASYSQDDRRMFVVDTPEKREKEFYERMTPQAKWRRDGGAKAVLRHLLEMDLAGWTPPSSAPMTPEKYMAYVENLTPAERLAEETHTADENVVALWIRQSIMWAETAEAGNDPISAKLAREIMDSLPMLQIRPFYSPEELALMFPSIASTLHSNKRAQGTVAGELSQGLRNAGVTYLRCSDDPRGFRWQGTIRQYLVIAEPDSWRAPISQKQFEQHMAAFPRFKEYAKKAAKQ